VWGGGYLVQSLPNYFGFLFRVFLFVYIFFALISFEGLIFFDNASLDVQKLPDD